MEVEVSTATLHENNQRINSCRVCVAVCVCLSFFLHLFLLLFENIPIFSGFVDGISALFKHCMQALLWFMTYLFSFCSAYLSFGTFHFSRCQEKKNRIATAVKMKTKETFGVKCDYVYNLTDKGILCVCVFVDNWFFWRTFCNQIADSHMHCVVICLFFSLSFGSEKNQQKLVFIDILPF